MKNWYVILLLLLIGCHAISQDKPTEILPGIYQMDEYLAKLSNKNVGLFVNHSSLIEGTHLTDTLAKRGIDITKVFTPEHGFKGTHSDGEEISYNGQKAESFELISLYGNVKKPTNTHLANLDIIVFDIQDVGVRFYTYISSMHYMMEACAERNIPFIVLDRPNPNGSYIDGPVLDLSFQSFVGMHPIPIIYGMTIGELALMINGEQWLSGGNQCELSVIPIKNWDHNTTYSLPVKPSPNLTNDLSISLYPSLCLFEGTIMSVGRGTDYAFQQVGHPKYPNKEHSFTPRSREGAKWPPYQDKTCYGTSWIGTQPSYQFSLAPLIDAYQKMESELFFNDYFNKLAGNDVLKNQIESGMLSEKIKDSWQEDLNQFKLKRANYLIYN